MLELLSLAFGGIFRLLPEGLKFLTSKSDQKHELAMTKLQLEIDKARAEQQLDLAAMQGKIASEAAELQAMVEAMRSQSAMSGVKVIDALSQSVRPVLTYWWCLVLYTIAKLISIAVAFHENTSLGQLSGVLVTEFDRMVISSIISFWFVDRAIRRQ